MSNSSISLDLTMPVKSDKMGRERFELSTTSVSGRYPNQTRLPAQ
ncbi:protein of unknown function [Candidatus Nitrosotalea okcheonensis]|uniref:Uncharacterized protein n=1 Tax=Candidatus Nitrosotalea okcheonensis TaxID=1903276 RepID=A0A2H1FH06_9ARCH|nr:protein of unknown function [Candidatus Nitrosotalea okcheonensis]